MRKLLFPLLTILLLTACQKQISTDKVSEEIAGAAANKQAKFTVCHYDPETGTSKSISVPQNALAGHLSHGDIEGECSAVLTTICDQDWMVKNLDVTKYRNGEDILQATTDAEWIAAGIAGTGAWCYYPGTGTTYGKLYNWYAVNDLRGLAPTGWHVPTDAEWTTLENCLDAISPTGNVGGKMKEIGTTHWTIPNTGATNISGFTGLPGGFRFLNGTFVSIRDIGIWWSSSEENANDAWERFLSHNNGDLVGSSSGKRLGFSVRCLRD